MGAKRGHRNCYGLVTDPQNAAIAGADVKLTDVATHSELSTTSNDQGRYTFASVPPGSYDLTVTKQGFSLAKASNQKVDVGQSLTLNVTLQVGRHHPDHRSTIRRGSRVANAQLDRGLDHHRKFRSAASQPRARCLLFQFTNILNHFQPANPSMNIDSPQTWASSPIRPPPEGADCPPSTPVNSNFGLRIRF